jgi:hypothetical protein
MRRRAVIMLLVVLVPLSLLLAAGAAATSNTAIGFDDLSAGAVVTSHYAADGVTFGRASDYGLVYRFARRPGQSVEFFEISGQVHRALGSTAGGSGSIAFTAGAGRGRRQIVAEVYGDGAPRVRTTVTSYLAQAPVRL